MVCGPTLQTVHFHLGCFLLSYQHGYMAAPLIDQALPKNAADASAATTRAEAFRQQHAIAFQVTATTRCQAIDDLEWMQRAINRTLSRVTDNRAISEKEVFDLLRSLTGDMNLFAAQCEVKFGSIAVKCSSEPITVHGITNSVLAGLGGPRQIGTQIAQGKTSPSEAAVLGGTLLERLLVTLRPSALPLQRWRLHTWCLCLFLSPYFIR